jgi:hypothetical protein
MSTGGADCTRDEGSASKCAEPNQMCWPADINDGNNGRLGEYGRLQHCRIISARIQSNTFIG